MGKLKYRWSGWLLLLMLVSALAAPISPLPVDQAFPLKVWSPDPQTIVVEWNIQPGYYLYKDRIQVQAADDGAAELGKLRFPEATEHDNPILGHFSAYDKPLQLGIPVLSARTPHVELQIKYQGCAEQGYCYPPQTRLMSVDLGVGNSQPVSTLSIDRIPQTSSGSTFRAPAQALAQHHYRWPVWLGFFGLGLLISLTPCVLPMVPLLFGLIIGKAGMSHGRAFLISLAYVLGMAITYAIAGVLFGFLGSNIQAYLQKPWIIAAFSLIFIAMALSLWGVYFLEPPEKLRTWMADFSSRQRGGSLIKAAVMGCLSTLILSPCATPPLVAVLTYISQTGNARLGGIALFVIGLGSGVPLLLIGAFGRRLLPKPGPWMRAVENILGIILAGMAIWMLSRILPGQIILILWAVLAVCCAVYLKAFSSPTGRRQLFIKGLGILIFVYGILLLVGAMQGATRPWEPLGAKISSCSRATQANFIPVKSIEDVKQHMELAAGKPVIIDFYADWCVSCKLLEQRVFANPAVQKQLAGFLLLRADITANDATAQALMKYFNVIAPPTVLIFNQQHIELLQSRVIGEISSSEFLARMVQAK
jgi:thioredoxin:protein disulfide reductase